MMANDLYFEEFVGRKARIVHSTNPLNTGMNGVVCDETMNTIHLMVDGKERVIPKEGTMFLFQYGEKEVEIDGSSIIYRPEDRIKYHSRIEKSLKRRK